MIARQNRQRRVKRYNDKGRYAKQRRITRGGGVAVSGGGGGGGGGTDPPPEPTGWQTAFDSHSLVTIEAWYAANTGHLGADFDAGDLWSPDDDPTDSQTVDAAWLTANEGPNVVKAGGRWTVTGLHCSYLRIAVSDITFNFCYIHRPSLNAQVGHAIDVFDVGLASVDEVTNTGIILNYCTIEGGGDGEEGDYGDAIYYNPSAAAAEVDGLVMNSCNISKWVAGIKANLGLTANYNYVHDLDIFGADPHNTSASIRGQKVTMYRNCFTDGTSSALSCYADTDPYTDFHIVENVFRTDNAIYEVNFPVRAPNNWEVLEAGYDRTLIGNRFVEGTASDLKYFTEVLDNKLVTDDVILFGGGTAVGGSPLPRLLAGFNTGETGYTNPAQTIETFNYIPDADSTLFAFMVEAAAGHDTAISRTLTDNAGETWSALTGGVVTKESAPAGLTQYGLSAAVYTTETETGEVFRTLKLDPYSTTDTAYMTLLVAELEGAKGLTLVQPAKQSKVGSALGFGVTVTTAVSGSLDNPANAASLCLFFVGFSHEAEGAALSTPSGWTKVAETRQIKGGGAIFARTGFTGQSVTVATMVASAPVVTVLAEFDVP